MSHPHNYLAIDLGAESGRVILGQFDESRLTAVRGAPLPERPGRCYRPSPR